jgi:glycosyltransferase involved in cell wall biosynthesis
LKSAYEQALLFVFPSYNEGFGIPILEAFAAEIPVLVANNSCLPEVGANAVISFDPFSIVDMMEKMKIVVENIDLQKDLIEKGKDRLLDFSWEQASKEMIEVFIMAAKHGK